MIMHLIGLTLVALTSIGATLDFIATLRSRGYYSSPGHRIIGLGVSGAGALFSLSVFIWISWVTLTGIA
jgi:predicted proteasome-type protease